MAKKVFGVEGVEGKRSSDRDYSHAVVGVFDHVASAQAWLDWAKKDANGQKAEHIAHYEAALEAAKAKVAAGVKAEIVSFHSSEALARKAASALVRYNKVEVRPAYRIK